MKLVNKKNDITDIIKALALIKIDICERESFYLIVSYSGKQLFLNSR